MPIPNKLRLAATLFLFALIVFVCFFSGLDGFGLVGPDEPRYASVAREMARSGDWLTPRLNGAPWFEKPPLYYWSAAIGFRLFASPEVAARAPSGAFALAALLALMLVARRLYGPDTSNLVGWILPTTMAMTTFAHAAATDMPFASCLTLTMVAAAHLALDDAPLHPRGCAAAFGAALGLATLAKGPAAVALAGGSVALWAICTGSLRKAWRLCHPIAILAFAAVAVPWYALCAARNPGFLRVFLLEHNIERFLTNRYQHHQPFWFFAPILLIAIFPWTLLLVPAITDAWRAFRSGAWRHSPHTFFAAWVIFPFLFFSASQSKLPGYILPAVPPLLLLLVRTLVRDEKEATPAPQSRLLWVSLALMAAGSVPFIRAYINPASLSAGALPVGRDGTLIPLGTMFFFGGAVIAAVSRIREPRLSATIASGVFALSVGLAAYRVLPALGPEISPRELAFEARDHASGAAITVYELPRAWQYGSEFYLQRRLPEWTPATPRPAWTITTEKGLLNLPRLGVQCTPAKPQFGPAILVRVD